MTTRSVASRQPNLPTDADSKTDTDLIEVRRFVTTPATVRVSYPLKMTHNYHTVGVEIGVTMPCYTAEIPDAFEAASKMCVERLRVELPKLKESLRKLEEFATRQNPVKLVTAEEQTKTTAQTEKAPAGRG